MRKLIEEYKYSMTRKLRNVTNILKIMITILKIILYN